MQLWQRLHGRIVRHADKQMRVESVPQRRQMPQSDRRLLLRVFARIRTAVEELRLSNSESLSDLAMPEQRHMHGHCRVHEAVAESDNSNLHRIQL